MTTTRSCVWADNGRRITKKKKSNTEDKMDGCGDNDNEQSGKEEMAYGEEVSMTILATPDDETSVMKRSRPLSQKVWTTGGNGLDILRPKRDITTA